MRPHHHHDHHPILIAIVLYYLFHQFLASSVLNIIYLIIVLMFVPVLHMATNTATATANASWRPATIHLLMATLSEYETAAATHHLSPHQHVSLGYRLLTSMLKKIEAARDKDWIAVEGDEPFPSPVPPKSPISPSLSSVDDAPIILPLAAILPINTRRSLKRHKH
jgi:hypothetical protein